MNTFNQHSFAEKKSEINQMILDNEKLKKRAKRLLFEHYVLTAAMILSHIIVGAILLVIYTGLTIGSLLVSINIAIPIARINNILSLFGILLLFICFIVFISTAKVALIKHNVFMSAAKSIKKTIAKSREETKSLKKAKEGIDVAIQYSKTVLKETAKLEMQIKSVIGK